MCVGSSLALVYDYDLGIQVLIIVSTGSFDTCTWLWYMSSNDFIWLIWPLGTIRYFLFEPDVWPLVIIH